MTNYVFRWRFSAVALLEGSNLQCVCLVSKEKLRRDVEGASCQIVEQLTRLAGVHPTRLRGVRVAPLDRC